MHHLSPLSPKGKLCLHSGQWDVKTWTACARFTPNNSGQRLPPTYYRGCWHVVSRGFLIRYRQEFYDPKTFFTHAALLHQAFAHCGRFPTAASRRSLGRVSVPVWPITLSGRLRIVALPRFPGVIPNYRAGCPRVTHPSAANFWEQAPIRPLDLHVLGTPPAFVLSQDQTLHKRKFDI
ncbi:hypothetical protein C1646_748743 [Rhizophagus diaphanus]|nr:hypothetical protein C1646_748743 [Rhizophagus diaphanus] [Rhizophagus sp. MUCL 43196]